MSDVHGPANSPLFRPGAHRGATKITVPPVVIGIPPGGAVGEAVIKLSDADYDAGWANCEVTAEPPNPVLIAWINDSELAGAADAAAYGTDYVVLACDTADALGVIDVTVPSTPTKIGRVTSTTQLDRANGVAVSGNHAFVCARLDNSITSVDLTTPSTPTIVSSVVDATNLANCQYILIDGTLAYVTCYNSNRVTIVDISNPAAMSVVGSVQDATNLLAPVRLVKVGTNLFVAAENANRVTTVDVSTPASPAVIGSVQDATHLLDVQALAYRDGHVFAAGWNVYVTAIDVSTPASPSVVGWVQDTAPVGWFNGVYGMTIDADGWLHVPALASDRYTVVDISDPTAMSVLASITDATNLTSPMAACIIGRHAYVPRDVFTNTFAVVEF